MTIALDYDGTYTRDPDLWDRFITDCSKSGHLVICVTQRTENTRPGRRRDERVPRLRISDEEGTITLEPIPIICAGDQFKLDAARAAGYSVAIWIDDMPATISQSVLLP
jgi:hypothetical protein